MENSLRFRIFCLLATLLTSFFAIAILSIMGPWEHLNFESELKIWRRGYEGYLSYWKHDYGRYLNGGKVSQNSSFRHLLSACRSYATDNKGRFPATLEDLYPEHADYKELLEFKNPDTKKMEPYIYFPGLTDMSSTKLPLVVSPSIRNGLRLVGLVNGEVLSLTEKEYSNLTKGGHAKP